MLGWPQTTLASTASLSGPGLHTGRRSTVTLIPALADHGLVFGVSAGGRQTTVASHWRNRVASRMNTALGIADGGKLRTVEHLLAALTASGIDNLTIGIEGDEIPIQDGSALGWCGLIEAAGTTQLKVARRSIRITRPVEVAFFESFIRAEPHDGLALDVTVDQPTGFGPMAWRGEIGRESFARELAASRSFGDLGGIWRQALRTPGAVRLLRPRLHAHLLGRAYTLGPTRDGSVPGPGNRPRPEYQVAIPPDIIAALQPGESEPVLRGARPGRAAFVVGGRVLGGARFPDEPVRHKALDLLGDLALAGLPLLGRVVAHAPTHALSYAFVATLMQTPDAWEITGPPDDGRPA